MYFNNQRAFIFFNEYFNSNKEIVYTAQEINNKEVFFFPNIVNKNHCKFIKYGAHNIGRVLVKSGHNYYCESVIK